MKKEKILYWPGRGQSLDILKSFREEFEKNKFEFEYINVNYDIGELNPINWEQVTNNDSDWWIGISLGASLLYYSMRFAKKNKPNRITLINPFSSREVLSKEKQFDLSNGCNFAPIDYKCEAISLDMVLSINDSKIQMYHGAKLLNNTICKNKRIIFANENHTIDNEKAQIELAKVASDASESQLSQYWNQAAESAKKYGATVSDVISSTADWKRLGASLDDAKELSDMTTLLQRVGDNMTQETSSSGLISALKGFQLKADQAQHIVDVANEVANTQPIDTAGIFEAIERSASSLKAAGNTYEQGVALASAANSVIQNPEKIGTALKTISMRIRSAETDLEEAGLDTEGMVTSTAKLRKEMLALSGVDILKDKDTFKSTYQILDELANKWSDLTDIQQADYTCLYVQKCA